MTLLRFADTPIDQGLKVLACLLLSVSLLAAAPAAKPKPRKLKPDAPEAVRVWWDAQPKLRETKKKQLRETMKQLQAETAAIRRAHVRQGPDLVVTRNGDKEYIFGSSASKKAALDKRLKEAREAKELLDGMENRVVYTEPEFKDDIKVGLISTLHSFRMKQVSDETNAIISVKDVDIWFKGLPTKNFADDTNYTLDEPIPYFITGTKSYATVTGAKRTILLAEPFKIEDYLTR
jgi:hypothetical protein